MKKKKHGFTLAEVLITLVVIGVVAAMTLPTLIKNINSQKRTVKIQNIEAKLRQGTDLMKVQGRINGFDDTMEFVTELSKYMKITTICEKGDMANCWPGINVTGIIVNGEEKRVEVTYPKDASWFKLNTNDYTPPVGFVTGDGTPMIISYNKNCFVDENIRDSDSTKCIAGVFDINGGNLPNRYGDTDKDKPTSDIIPINVIGGIDGKAICVFALDGTCFVSQGFLANDSTAGGCEKLQDFEIDTKNCNFNPDYWANAYLKCIESGGRLPNSLELQKIASYVYNTPISGTASNVTLDVDKAKSLNIYSNNTHLWSIHLAESGYASYRYYQNGRTGLDGTYGYRHNKYYAICVAK